MGRQVCTFELLPTTTPNGWLRILAAAAVAFGLFSNDCTGWAAALNAPAMSGPLVANPDPASFDAGTFGTIYVTGVASGLGFWQDNHSPGDQSWRADASNAQVFVQKTNGWLQFFVDAGAYSLPALGATYTTVGHAVADTFGIVPQAYLKLAPTDTFSVEAGKLPSQIGIESAFTIQNVDIERGLLWNQTPTFTRGVQANYANGPVTIQVSWNDGYYSDRLNWITGSASYALHGGIDTFTLIGGANLGHTGYSSYVTPLAGNNSSICDLAYTHIFGSWMIDPYIQLSNVPQDAAVGFMHNASTIGSALLLSYSFGSELSLAGRGEYIASSGRAVAGTPNLLFGPGSDAWSLTLTPTFQHGIFFVRGEASYVDAGDTTAGKALGEQLDKTSQTRLMFETGVLF